MILQCHIEIKGITSLREANANERMSSRSRILNSQYKVSTTVGHWLHRALTVHVTRRKVPSSVWILQTHLTPITNRDDSTSTGPQMILCPTLGLVTLGGLHGRDFEDVNFVDGTEVLFVVVHFDC